MHNCNEIFFLCNLQLLVAFPKNFRTTSGFAKRLGRFVATAIPFVARGRGLHHPRNLVGDAAQPDRDHNFNRLGRLLVPSWRGCFRNCAAVRDLSPASFCARKAARVGMLALPGEDGPMLVAAGASWRWWGNHRKTWLIRIEIAGAMVHAGARRDSDF
jgi:hypothetical protein